MALFELDGERLIPAQFGREIPDAFSADVLHTVRQQVLEIVSRPLFPVTWRDITRPRETSPRLTALDASGQVVAVEVVRNMDSEVLIDALSALADTAAMSWTDLAREYVGGIDGFKVGWAQFREAMPASPPNGPRLILVTSSISDEVRPALDVLSSSGVEVHEMALRQMANGRQFLEVNAVGPRLYGHRANLLVGQDNVVPLLQEKKQQTISAGAAPAPASPSVSASVSAPAPVSQYSAPAAYGQQTSQSRATRPNLPQRRRFSDPDATRIAPRPAQPAQPVQTVQPVQPAQQVQPAQPTPSYQMSDQTPLTDAGMGYGRTPLYDQATQAPRSVPASTMPVPPAPVRSAPVQPAPVQQRPVQPTGQPEYVRPEYVRPANSTTPRARYTPSITPRLTRSPEGLAAIAASLGKSTALYLLPVELTPQGSRLSAQGWLETPSGRYYDPSAALKEEGLTGADGWDAWHIGDQFGPTLAEALNEVNRNR